MNNRTNSEKLTKKISELLVFKEFTFDGNKVAEPVSKSEKELADNIMWLDELFVLIQIKERNVSSSNSEVNRWFKNKVINKAKKQIGSSLKYLKGNPKVQLTNVYNQKINFDYNETSERFNIILYDPNEAIEEELRWMKFYESSVNGLIHLFHIEDYLWVCKHLQTPYELKEYLEFRERLYLYSNKEISRLPEQYVLGHFLTTDTKFDIDLSYVEKLMEFKDERDFDMSGLLSKIGDPETYMMQPHHEHDYHYIIKFFAKMSREHLFEAKKRVENILAESKNPGELSHIPKRVFFNSLIAGLVTMVVPVDHYQNAYEYVGNMTRIYAYKRKTKSCLGVGVYWENKSYHIVWAYHYEPRVYNQNMERIVEKERDFYGSGKVLEVERYNV